MELSFVSNHTIKIKTKKTTLVVDPDGKTSADVALFTSSHEGAVYQQANMPYTLLITGPGEFEVGGVMVKARSLDGHLLFQIFSADGSLFLLDSSVIGQVKEEDGEQDAAVIHVDSKLDDRIFSQFASKLFVLYGDSSLLSFSSEVLTTLPSVNLSKHGLVTGKEEHASGTIILLSRN